ncbi:MAG: hypothetical protein COB35_05830 [Gammaproteobacteria bacterium]|nr:MAG: hypothetical protein COB35_05830 [Gammaproteobacteria bacterium]
MEIILIRHGKPTSAKNARLTAGGFAQWVRQYNLANVADDSRPKECLAEDLSQYFVLASDFKRAIHSAKIFTKQAPDLVLTELREMDIPRYKFPLHLKAWTWVYLNRLCWMLGLKGSFESYKEAKQRANLATNRLLELVQHQEKLLVFGHGYMNFHIRKQLVKQGWQLNSKNSDYWGITLNDPHEKVLITSNMIEAP